MFINGCTNLPWFPDDLLCISWTDSEGVIFSSGFSFFKNLPLALVLVLVLVLQRFGRRQWGHIPELTVKSQTVLLHPVNAGGVLSEEEVVVNFHPEDKIRFCDSLLGRGTAVIGASRKEKGENGTARGQGEAEGRSVGDVPRNYSENIQRTQGEAGKHQDWKGGRSSGTLRLWARTTT